MSGSEGQSWALPPGLSDPPASLLLSPAQDVPEGGRLISHPPWSLTSQTSQVPNWTPLQLPRAGLRLHGGGGGEGGVPAPPESWRECAGRVSSLGLRAQARPPGPFQALAVAKNRTRLLITIPSPET